MTRKETHAAIHLSLLLGDSSADRHGVYARRKPVPPPKPLIPAWLMEDPTGFAPGCVVDWVPPHE